MIRTGQSFTVFLLMAVLAACTRGRIPPPPNNFMEVDPYSVVPTSFWVRAEELGWSSGYTKYMSSALNPSPSVAIENVSGINLSFSPLRDGKGAPRHDYRASQVVYVYSDEQTASKAFEEMQQPGESVGVIWQPLPLDDELKMDTGVIWCRRGPSEFMGEVLSCQIQIQHGRYVIWSWMQIDGKWVTNEDWEVMLDLIQQRLVKLD